MVKKKLTEKKLNKEELTRILRDACNSTRVELELRDLLEKHHREIREYLGVSPRTMRRYRGQLNDKVRQIEVGRKVRREELQRYSEKNDSLNKKVHGLTEYKYSATTQIRDLELEVEYLGTQKNGLLVAWILTAIIPIAYAWWTS